eukprot:7385254-Prymnesium_polylepis.1
MQTVVKRATMGSVVHAVFDVVARATGKRGRGDSGKLVEMNGVTEEAKGHTIRGARAVREQAREFGVKQHAEGWACTTVATEWMQRLWQGRAGERAEGDGLAAALSPTGPRRL